MNFLSTVSTRKKTIYIPIEWINRELDSFIIFSTFAVKKGFRVIIGSKRAISLYVIKKEFKAGVFFYKGGPDKNLCSLIEKKCDALAILDQEIGPIHNENLNYKIPSRFYKGTLKFVSKYYCIGKKVFKIANKVFKNKIKGEVVLTGWPRVDLWTDQYKKFYSEETNEIKKKYKRYIFFSSNFSKEGMDLLQINQMKKRAKSYWTTHNHHLKKKIKIIKSANKEFKSFKNFLNKYEKQKKLPMLVIRPHPNEDINIWKKIVKNFSKIKIENLFDIHPWISNSEMILHRGCTSSAHAQVSGKKVVMLKLTKKNE